MKKHLLLLLFAFAMYPVVAQDTVEITLCKHFWKNGEPINGGEFSMSETLPGWPGFNETLYPLDSNENCVPLSFVSDGLPGGYTRCFTADKIDNHLNGISILDIIAMKKHILGEELLPPPYALLAADLNLSGTITTFDMVTVNRILLGISTPSTPPWRFFSETCQFPNPNNPFQGSTCPCILSEDMPSWDGDTFDLIGVKAGDVDGDADLSGQFAGPPTEGSVKLVLPDVTLAANVLTIVPIKFTGNNALTGGQIEFQLNVAKASLSDISSAGFHVTADNWSLFPSGHFGVAAIAESSPVPDGGSLFLLHITASEATPLADLIQIKKLPLAPIVTSALQSKALKIDDEISFGTVAVQNPTEGDLVVGAASPNPFFDKTYILVKLGKTEQIRLEMTDLTGRQVYAAESVLGAGEHRLEIPASALAPGSMGVYRVRAGQRVQVGKLTRL